MQLLKLRMILVKFFSYILDFFIVSRKINKEEIIIRTLLQPKHLSSGSSEFQQKKFDQYFLPLNGGVSVDRYRYQNENKSKQKAKKVFKGEQKYIGFAFFDMKIFEESLNEYCMKYKNDEFLAEITSSPLNLKMKEIKSKIIFVFQRGNVAHADIVYRYPNYIEVPQTSIRSFSKILAAKSKKVLDKNIEDINWKEGKFSKLI